MFVYLLHFNTKLSHAQHYVGSTLNLEQRLKTHARRAGSNLTRVVSFRGISWELAGLYQAKRERSRMLEYELKMKKNTPLFCEVCSSESQPILAGGIRYPLSELTFATRSAQIAPGLAPLAPCIIVPASLEKKFIAEKGTDLEFIAKAMYTHKQELGFLTHAAISNAILNCNCLIAVRNHARVGYCIYTKNHGRSSVKIHQMYTVDEERLTNVAYQLLQTVKIMHSYSQLEAKVRSDLPANGFWVRQGFVKTRTILQASKLNVYHCPPMLIAQGASSVLPDN